jgi:hypothetical protein
MDPGSVNRDFGASWKARLDEAREKAATQGRRLSAQEIVDLEQAVATSDVSTPHNMALLWSGRNVPTGIRMDEGDAASPMWWDKLASREAEVFRTLGLCRSLEDTPGGQFLIAARVDYPEDDPLASVIRTLWEKLSARFVAVASGRVEIIAEGSFAESVFRGVEFGALLANDMVTAVNGLERRLLPPIAADAFALLRRWDVERSRRYAEFIGAAADASPYERATAVDDFRESQLWFEQDFFESLGPGRELPTLRVEVMDASDQAMAAGAWKYSPSWRAFIRGSEGDRAVPGDS